MAEQTTQISIRVSPPLVAFLRRWAQASSPTTKTATVGRYAVEVFQSLTEELGPDWHEVVRQAAEAGQEPGAFIGSIVKATLRGNGPKHAK